MIKAPQQNELGKVDYGAIIFKEGDYYVAEDYNGRKIKEDDTDAAKVFQAVIDELNWGGLIFVRKAEYPIRSTVEFKYGRVRMRGEYHDVSTLIADATFSPMMKISNDIQQVTLEHLAISGDSKTTIVFDGSRTVSGFAQMNFNSCAIYGATSKNMVLTNREEVLISNCIIGEYPHTSPYNIYVDGLNGWLILNDKTVVHNATTDSIYFKGSMLSMVNAEAHTRDSGSAQIRIVEGLLNMTNSWTDHSAVRGVVGGGVNARLTAVNSLLNGGVGGSYNHINFNNTQLFTSGALTHDIDCTVSKRATGNVILKGTIDITGKYHLYDLDAGTFKTNIIATDNETGTGAEQVIAHGLADTPAKVQLWQIDWGGDPHQSFAANATNIYLKNTSGKKYGWQAEV